MANLRMFERMGLDLDDLERMADSVVEGDFVKAISLLPPGFCNTPEYGAIVDAKLPRHEKYLMIQQATSMNMDQVKLSKDFSLIKWFHDAGIPQVIESEQAFYARAV